MPLVVPGINSGGDDQKSQWMNKLMGKKIGDTTDSTVQPPHQSTVINTLTKTQNFAKQDLPKESRVLEHGSMATQDFNKDRMNIHLSEDGTVKHVDFK
ncbi:hypothetical protein MMC06_004538 [Schaereria dolodes]|nr:hypothetical protein [Schaereria dolodes]